MATLQEEFRARAPDAGDDAPVDEMIADAGGFIMAYTGRAAVPAALASAQVRLAVIFYNRMGMEGETRHSEGDVVHEAESLPEEILAQIRPYRLARAVGI